jgi:type VI secretion system protein ImpF
MKKPMNHRTPSVGFAPSLLDKLLGPARQPTHGVSHAKPLSFSALKASLASDLESLLNSRRTSDNDAFSDYPESINSILTFGIRDFVGYSLANPDDCNKICETIQKAIERHEPRLTLIQVKLEKEAYTTNSLCFSISAVIRAEQKRVSFDAVLKPSLQQYAVTLRNHQD